MLTAVLERFAAEREGVLGVVPGLVIEPDDSWTPVADLLGTPLLGRLVDETAARWNAPRHVGAALLWKTYSYWHTLPMAVGWALDGRVPIMKFQDTWFKVSPAGVTIGATSVTWSDVSAIRPALLESQEPLVKELSRIARVGERTLWGSTAEAVAHPLQTYVPGDYMRLLSEIGKPVDGLIRRTADGYLRRTCCLWITLPDVEPCSTCCVLSGN
ncbi:(2Fe-2S)-binding protein [Thermoactinospora rubra]|uniref:(2Fe-2S)-binding protein n=1 Tax=Thermoactinospora rubra TaxID=1088767 RepID=UPI000A118D03|nr:(2Fe-2S)-binding protein [Thermoactinospora rubra]